MKRRAFSVIEVLVVIGVIGAATALTIPLYREYQIRSDLDNAAQQATQGLARAKLLSQLGEQDASWGFYVPAGTLYKGVSYESRVTAFDEVFPMPSTIAIQGLFDVSFTKVQGIPSAMGDIVLRALNNDERIIQVTIAVDAQTVPADQGNVLTICHYPPGNPGAAETIQVPEATWPQHQGHGDVVGNCPNTSSAAASSANSSAISSARSSAASSAHSSIAAVASSAAGGGGGGGACSKFTLSASQAITVNTTSSVVFTNLLSQITFGAGGPTVPVHACYSTNGGTTQNPLFGGNGNCNGNGNAYGNAVTPAGTDTKTASIAAGSNLAVRITGRYRQHNWLAFFGTFLSNANDGHILVMENGDTLSDFPGFGSQTPLKNSLVSRGKANESGQITIGDCELLLVAELGDLNTSASDFQDDVMLVTFN